MFHLKDDWHPIKVIILQSLNFVLQNRYVKCRPRHCILHYDWFKKPHLKYVNVTFYPFGIVTQILKTVIRQKGETQNWGNKKTKHTKFPKSEYFLPPDTHTYVSESKKCLFLGKFGMLCFLVTSVLRFFFFLITNVLWGSFTWRQLHRLKTIVHWWHKFQNHPC